MSRTLADGEIDEVEDEILNKTLTAPATAVTLAFLTLVAATITVATEKVEAQSPTEYLTGLYLLYCGLWLFSVATWGWTFVGLWARGQCPASRRLAVATLIVVPVLWVMAWQILPLAGSGGGIG